MNGIFFTAIVALLFPVVMVSGCSSDPSSALGVAQGGAAGRASVEAGIGGSTVASGYSGSGNGGERAGAAGSVSPSGGMPDLATGAGFAGQAGTGGSTASSGGGSGAGAGAGSGASATGGAANGGVGGAPATVCNLPDKFQWTTTAALTKLPKSIAGHSASALKDFTSVFVNGKHTVYATAYEGGWKSAMFTFADWPDWESTPGTWFPRNAVAPSLVYFTPKKLWVLTYQWGFQYATSTDPTDASKWSPGNPLLNGGPPTGLDQTFICDATNCYLFLAGDDGNIYRSEMRIGNFPSTFTGYKTILSDTSARLFEAVQVYALKGLNKYLMLVEAQGSGGRYFRAFTADSLGGTFIALPGAESESSPFAGKANVSGQTWSNDISHGDIVRSDPSETQTIDLCHLQFLYQGYDKGVNSSTYEGIPYRPAVLTLQR